MRRPFNYPLALFLSGATIFCAAGWSTQSVAAWASHPADAPEGNSSHGFVIGALPGTASPASAPPGASVTGNGTVRSNGAVLAPPTPFARPPIRTRELDTSDPWNGLEHSVAHTSGHKRLEIEAADPWEPERAMPARVARRQLQIDPSDPWVGLPKGGDPAKF